MNPDVLFMMRAYLLAQKGLGLTSPNPMVGALIVKNGKVLASGWHKRCGSLHAEAVALNKAGKRSAGATLYVTLEPCFHFGRTPPCVDDIIRRKIKKVVIGVKDPNPLTCGKSIQKLKEHGIKVSVLEQSNFRNSVYGEFCQSLDKLNEAFEKYITKKIPFVVAKTAQTLDGKVAAKNGKSQWITSPSTRHFAKKKRREFDAIVVGIETVLADNPQLNAPGRNRPIKKVVLDSSLRTPAKARLFQNTRLSDCILAVTKKASPTRIAQFRKKGCQVIICPQREGRISMIYLLKALAAQDVMNLLIEGGAHVIGGALEEKVVDKMHIYVAPKIFGDEGSLSSVAGLKVKDISRLIKLRDIKVCRLEGDLLVEGYISY